MLDVENIFQACTKTVFRYLNTTCTTFRHYCVFRAWPWLRRLHMAGFVWFLIPLHFVFLLTASYLIVPLALHIHWLQSYSKRQSISVQRSSSWFVGFSGFFWSCLSPYVPSFYFKVVSAHMLDLERRTYLQK